MAQEIVGSHFNLFFMPMFENYIVLDTETTGLYPSSDRIVELSMVRVRNHKVVAEYSQLFNPQKPISPGASAVNGISNDMVWDKPLITENKEEILDFLGEDVIVGHNIKFDMSFLCNELGYKTMQKFDTLDTITMAKALYCGQRSYSLINLCRFLGIADSQKHRALADVYLTFSLLETMLKKGETMGMRIEFL